MTSSIPTAIPSRAERRADAPFVPHARISERTALWAFTLGVGLVCPLVLSIAMLHLPAGAQSAEMMRRNWAQIVLHPQPLFLKAVIIAPLLEEILFRGLVLQLLRRYCPTGLAVAISAGFFGATHLGAGLANALNATILGCVFAWLVIRTRSLLTSVLCHGAFNFCWLFLLVPAFGLLEKTLAVDLNSPAPSINPLTDMFPSWWIAISLGLAITSVLVLRKTEPRQSTVR